MQVERDPEGSNVATCPGGGENLGKLRLIPNAARKGILPAPKGAERLPLHEGPAHHRLVGGVTAHQGSRLAGLRGWPAALGLRYCPDSYGRGSFAMGESLTMRRCVEDEGLRVVNSCHEGKGDLT